MGWVWLGIGVVAVVAVLLGAGALLAWLYGRTR